MDVLDSHIWSSWKLFSVQKLMLQFIYFLKLRNIYTYWMTIHCGKWDSPFYLKSLNIYFCCFFSKQLYGCFFSKQQFCRFFYKQQVESKNKRSIWSYLVGTGIVYFSSIRLDRDIRNHLFFGLRENNNNVWQQK